MRPVKSSNGQSTVEFALVLPFVMVLLMLTVQVGLVARDRVLTTHAARAGARAAAVHAGSPAVRDAVAISSGLDPGRLSVREVVDGSRVTVTVRYRSPTEVPLVGLLVDDVDLESSVTMRLER
ncbi:MAG: TadE family protein [Acidimicrobiales bacterium]|jgi:hypothetical protein